MNKFVVNVKFSAFDEFKMAKKTLYTQYVVVFELANLAYNYHILCFPFMMNYKHYINFL